MYTTIYCYNGKPMLVVITRAKAYKTKVHDKRLQSQSTKLIHKYLYLLNIFFT